MGYQGKFSGEQIDERLTNAGDIPDMKEDIDAIRRAVGTPLTVSTAAGMTDKTKIYVYVGNETGYTYGNWYYWDGSAWTSGGVYNSQALPKTDKTLSTADVPADAKATGGAIGELKSALTQYQTKQIILESGTFTDGDGVTKSPNTARLRNTAPIDATDLYSITIPAEYSAWIFILDAEKAKLATANAWLTGTVRISTIAVEGMEFINVAFRKTNAPTEDISSNVDALQSDLILTTWSEYRASVSDNIALNNIISGKAEMKGSAVGWKLNTNGYSAEDANCIIKKYYVKENESIFVIAEDRDVVMQFQTSSGVPSVGTKYVVGDVIYNWDSGFLIVPDTATYFIMSVKVTDQTSGVYVSGLKSVDEKIESFNSIFASFINKNIFDIPVAYEQGTWNDTKQGKGEDSSTRVRSTNYLYSPTGNIYIASNTEALYWFVLEFDENLQYVKRSESPNGGWLRDTVIKYELSNPFFKIVLRKSDSTNIVPSEAAGFKISPILKYAGIDILQVDPDSTVSGWSLTGTGLSARSDTGASLYKYNVTGVDTVTLISNSCFQFQTASNVPAEGVNSWLIGDVVKGQHYGKVEVPTGATHLIISVENNDTNSGVYVKHSSESRSNDNVTAVSPNPLLFTEKFIGHKGGGKTAPENTIPCLEQGYENGFKIFEFDIQFTSDDIPVLLHDTTINRTARNADGSEISGTINIGSITYDQARTYDFGIRSGATYAGTKIPTLEDAILWIKARSCCAEIDITGTENLTNARVKIIYDILKSKGMLMSSLITLNLSILSQMALNGKDICVCISNIGTSESAVINAAAAKDVSIYTACSVQYPYLTEDQMDYVHKYGMMVKAFTITDSTGYNTVTDYGCDMMLLDHLYPNDLI